MARKRKGKGYNPAAVVAGAVEKCSCPERKFLVCAAIFGQTEEILHTTHPVAVNFADWVTIKSPKEIGHKMGCSCPGDK